MELLYKPDFEEARRRWDAFWQGEIVDRPCLHIVVAREGVQVAPRPRQLAGLDMGDRQIAEMFDAHLATVEHLAEAIPHLRPGLGPDTFAGLLGADLKYARDSGDTNWAEPFVDDWDAAMPLGFRNQELWRRIISMTRAFAKVAEGRWLVGQMDIHSNMDALLAIRGSERLCLDHIERPEAVARAMAQVRPLFARLYDAVFEAGNMAKYGSVGWTPFYSRGKFATIQCDFACMISPPMCRRFVIPALAEEAAHLDACTYHYDGPGALVHFDDICAIPDIHVIQWVQGAGRGSHLDWVDLLKRFQAAGKGLDVAASFEQAKVLHRELRPERVLYQLGGLRTRADAEAAIRWFEKNT